MENEVDRRMTARTLHVRAAKDLLRRRLEEKKTNLCLDATDVATLTNHRERIRQLDDELTMEIPRISALRQLQSKKRAVEGYAEMMKTVMPLLKSCAELQKRNNRKYRRIEKYADRLADMTETMEASMDDIVPPGTASSHDVRRTHVGTLGAENDDVIAEIVRGLFGRPMDTLQTQLGEAMISGEGMNHEISAEHISFPEVPSEGP